MDKKEKIIGSAAMIIICTIFLTVGYILSKPKAYNNEVISNLSNKYDNSVIVDNSSLDKNNSSREELKNIVVEIKGEVKNPDVYTMEYGSRIYDLVKKAGGFTENADKLSVNCSMKLKDEDCIIIYNKNDKERLTLPVVNNNSNRNENSPNLDSENKKIDINSASKEELVSLPGIGEVTAQKIIEYRESNGKFNSVEELMEVDRIGEKTLAKFRDKIEVR
ncbi:MULTISPECIES: ComEA family DNA-binding protein [Clostridium]|uniref:ComE operon protein 1 n=2 Tax=Clostridium TaxID=1485 RepID=A0A151ALP7_9CLOT|nr:MULTISPECIES: ComEA family DNA-binding protein [Clostridium]KYH28558.1 ComE operon protein 1 [Clostridium colicanis DSM 13634]MBE6042850.1 ComEA family DNA-binding protein [Clostridium thermopalmarium]PRR74154.1 ComE operon protein 1 [Clostridium thermopalmarium DSM 5974]PVZ25482.1 competence protein ComEA [Clostridium thermopalmarium DSM 5974]